MEESNHLTVDVAASSFDPEPWLRLLHTRKVGLMSALRLLQALESPTAIFNANDQDLLALNCSREIINNLRTPQRQRIEQDLRWLQGPHRYLLTLGSAAYPPMLASIPDPPLCIFVAGMPEVLSHPQCAIVGSRNPTAQGRENAAAFAHFLATRGFAITSGLARGIDTASHKGALQAGGFTVAVCGTGLDQVYPQRNTRLAGQIVESGALVSEFSIGTSPHARNFPQRNRIISGLATGTLVIEAAHRSGSLITARLAGEQGREIFTIPGSIHNPMARGCHRLLRDGARLVESGEDILEELGNLTRTNLQVSGNSAGVLTDKLSTLSHECRNILQNMGYEPSSINQLCQRTGLTAEAVSAMLLTLELEGYVQAAVGGRYSSSI